MYLEETFNTIFVTINNPDGEFIDILDEFPDTIQDTLSEVEVEVTDIFPTSICITLQGYKYELIEALGQITQLLITFNIFNFHFLLHTVEHLERNNDR